MNKRFAVLRKKVGNAYLKAGVVAALAVPAIASATPAGDPFSDAVGDATEKVLAYGAALVGLAAVGVVFMIAIKYVKKIRGAA